MNLIRLIRCSIPAKRLSRSLVTFFSLGALSSTCSCGAIERASLLSIASIPVKAYDYAEITATVTSPDVTNPFEDAALTGSFAAVDGSGHWNVDGFCDSLDGSVFRIRFMPPHPGKYKYSVTYRQGEFEKTSTGTFQAIDAHLRGILRVDPQYPWHFIWGRYRRAFLFFNGTTAYWMMGWKDDRTIEYSIARLHRLESQPHACDACRSERTCFYGEPAMIGENSGPSI